MKAIQFRIFLAGILTALYADMARAANFSFEPYVGLAKTQVRQNDTKYFDVADGFYLGAKASYKYSEKYFIGVDYHRGGPFKFGPLLGNSEWTHNMLGGGLTINYSIARYWLGYYWSNSYTDNTNSVSYTGTGIKVAIGFSVSSKLSCNFELLYSAINKMNFGYEAPFEGYDISSAHVSVSIPIK